MNNVYTQTKVETAQAEIGMSFIRFLQERADERVLEVVLVYNGVDRWDTIIDPTGMRTDTKVVTIDHNHNGVDTGAYLTNIRVVKDYVLEDGTVLEEALIGDVHVPKKAELFYYDGKRKLSNGNFAQAIADGHIKSFSVEFKPYKGRQITDIKTGIVTFKEWDLIRLSALDVSPGQPYSGYKVIRKLVRTMPQLIHEAIQNKLSETDANATVENLSLYAEFEAAGQSYSAKVEYNDDMSDVTVSDIQPQEARAEAEIEVENDEEATPAEATPNGEEEMRKVITEIVERLLDERMSQTETKRSEEVQPSEDTESPKAVEETPTEGDPEVPTEETKTKEEETGEQEDAEERLMKRVLNQLLNDAPEKVTPIAGDGKRQLGDEEGSTDSSKQEREARLKAYRNANGFKIK